MQWSSKRCVWSFIVQSFNICIMLCGILFSGWLNDTIELQGLHHSALSVLQMYIYGYATKQDWTVSIHIYYHMKVS